MHDKNSIIVNTVYSIYKLAKQIDNDMQDCISLCNYPVLKVIFHQIAFRCFLKTSIIYISGYMF